MKFVLYRYKKTPTGATLQYVKEVKNNKYVFSPLASDAKRFPFAKAFILSIKYRLHWIHERFIGKP